MPMIAGWVSIAIVTVADVVWLLLSGRTVAVPTWKIVLIGLLVSVALLGGRRLRRFRCAANCYAQNLLIFPVSLLFIYLGVAMDFPLRDAWMAAADRAIGFDYLSIYGFVSRSQIAMRTLGLFYFPNYVGQLAILLIVLPILNPYCNVELVVILTVTLVATGLMAMMMPVEGALFFLGAKPDHVLHEWLVLSLDAFRSIRNDSSRSLDLLQVNAGVAQFPSFHTSAAIIFSYAARGSGRWFRIAAIMNGLMILSIPIIGGHYFVDMIAGAAIAIAAIAVVRTLAPQIPEAAPNRLVDRPLRTFFMKPNGRPSSNADTNSRVEPT